MRKGPFDVATHQRYFATLPALQEIELGGEPAVATAERVRVAVWNVERLGAVEAVAEILLEEGADVALLSEVDKGMVRSGNCDCLADLATRLGHHRAYAVEFIELGLGDPSEAPRGTTADNALGFHGNAVTSALPLKRPFLIRLDVDGCWFGPERGQQRVGGRMAIGAQIRIDGKPVTLVSVHLESNSDPAGRAVQVIRLLDALKRYDPVAPTLIGGDFNTSTIDRRRGRDEEFRRAEFAAEPRRLIDVEAHEPLFAAMERYGFDWHACNLRLPTERRQPGQPERPLGKIDWIFSRDLKASHPYIIAALDGSGAQISDHDCLLVTIAHE